MAATPDKAYQEAEEKIEIAFRSQAMKLDLSGSAKTYLTQLPESLWQLSELQELNLTENRLTMLSENLGQLTHLRVLRLSIVWTSSACTSISKPRRNNCLHGRSGSTGTGPTHCRVC